VLDSRKLATQQLKQLFLNSVPIATWSIQTYCDSLAKHINRYYYTILTILQRSTYHFSDSEEFVTFYSCNLLFKPYVQGAPKIGTIFVRLCQILTDFRNYFIIRIRRKFVIILSLKIPPHLKCATTLLCEMSSVLKATTENKTTSATTHFKKLATGDNVFIVSIIV